VNEAEKDKLKLIINKKLLTLLLIIFLLASASCRTTRNIGFLESDGLVASREFLAAAEGLKHATGRASQYRDKDQVLRFLDIGMLFHFAGKPEQSIAFLNEAERLIEENFTRSITNAAASFLVNDYQLEYFGEAFEDLYINIFKAIDFMRLGSFDGAFVEIRRLTDKLNLLEDRYGNLARSMNTSEDAQGTIRAGRTEFHNSALARYLGVLLYRADGRRDSAAIDLAMLRQAFRDQPNIYNFPAPKNLDKMLERTDNARINIIGFTGQSPIKRASTLRITTLENLILITQEREDDFGRMILTDLTPIPFHGVAGGYNFRAQVPEMIKRPSSVSRIQILINGVPAGDLELLEKLDSVAVETFKLNQGMILFKTIVRTVTKGVLTRRARSAASAAAANAGGVAQLLSFLGGIALGVAVDATEQADLRSARYFPGQAYVGEFWVEPGEHIVTVEFFDRLNRLLYRETFPARNYIHGELYILTSYNLQ